jgi:hypothetical protein
MLGTCGLAGSAHGRAAEVSCDFLTEKVSGGFMLNGVVTAGWAVEGTYSLSVSGAGADIKQGGGFAVAAGETRRLGSVTLSGGSYEVRLDVAWPGGSRTCSTTVGR